MKKYYSQPEVEIREYTFVQSVHTLDTSTPETGDDKGNNGLEDDDLYDIFG